MKQFEARKTEGVFPRTVHHLLSPVGNYQTQSFPGMIGQNLLHPNLVNEYALGMGKMP